MLSLVRSNNRKSSCKSLKNNFFIAIQFRILYLDNSYNCLITLIKMEIQPDIGQQVTDQFDLIIEKFEKMKSEIVKKDQKIKELESKLLEKTNSNEF